MKIDTYKRYLMTMLSVILAFNYVDRFALALVLQNIKVDLHLTDTQLGFLTGIAFALFYSVMGIPIARWADRGNRVRIISTTTALWSAAVTLCGAAGTFMQLLLIRVCVAVGEAGCLPPAHSLIADCFTREERPRAVSRYMLGIPTAVLVGYFIAGWLNEFFGWRATFLLLGLPGMGLALTAFLTLREPPRLGRLFGRDQNVATDTVAPHVSTEDRRRAPSAKEVWATLWANRTFRHLLFCFAVVNFFGYGIGTWQAAYFVRSYGLGTGEIGTWFSAIYGLAGFLGTYVGGELASRYAANNERLQLQGMAWVGAGLGVISCLVYLSSSRFEAFAVMGLCAIAAAMMVGPLFAVIQLLVAEQMRATSIAIVYLFANLIGMGLGPLAAGALSDALRPHFGEESLRYALLALCPGYLWASWHVWRASHTVATDLQATLEVPAVLSR